MRRSRLLWCFLLPLLLPSTSLSAFADAGPAFDLDGPRIDVRVTRQGKILPIGTVASLASGDRLWVHPDLPEDAGAHYLLVVAFLRGSVDPPPDQWFTKAETWTKKIRQEGIYVTVPEGAKQALLFLAPETGGGFSTLRNAVRGRPGAFVRATQDLHQASLDRARLDTYVASVRTVDAGDPKAVESQTKLLARSLNIKVDQQCFDKPNEQMAPCLIQNPDSLVLDNGRSASLIQQATSGAAGDMLSQMSYTQQAGAGFYSVYVGTVLDMVRILDSFHTAQFQYLPALAIPKGDTLALKLNNPPSFHKPQSVLVVGLPPVLAPDAVAPSLPSLHAVSPKDPLCAQSKPLVLPVVGAPYVFATGYGHDFVLRLQNKAGKTVDVAAIPNPLLGGFVVNATALEAQALPANATGTLHGYWGFNAFDGPAFSLATAHAQQWTLAATDQHALIVGRKDTVHLEGAADAVCVSGVTATNADGKTLDVTWKAVSPKQIQVDLPLDAAQAGNIDLEVKQTGLDKKDKVPLHTYSEPAHLDGFKLYSGDAQAVLTGTRLDEVAAVTANSVAFAPATALAHAGNTDSLVVTAPQPTGFHAEQNVAVKVTLKDGRSLDLQARVLQARPSVKLMNKNIHSDESASVVQLGSPDVLPEHAELTFFVQANNAFPRDQSIEVASSDNSFSRMLHVGDGIVLQDSKTALVTLDPSKAFGGSAFGPLQFRPVSSEGVAGDWQPLATLVRVPDLKELKCVPDAPQCTLTGSNLFLLEQVAADAQMANAVTVPEGFGEGSLDVPRPAKTIYFKLRDDPDVVNTAVLPVIPMPAQSAASGGPAAR